MIKVAFCDDDLSMLNEIDVLLGKYRLEHKREITYTTFRSPFELLAEIEKGMRWDILLLDVLMPGEDGISVAKEIRRYDGVAKIIFLTTSSEFAVESYTVGAYFYQIKPVSREKGLNKVYCAVRALYFPLSALGTISVWSGAGAVLWL